MAKSRLDFDAVEAKQAFNKPGPSLAQAGPASTARSDMGKKFFSLEGAAARSGNPRPIQKKMDTRAGSFKGHGISPDYGFGNPKGRTEKMPMGNSESARLKRRIMRDQMDRDVKLDDTRLEQAGQNRRSTEQQAGQTQREGMRQAAATGRTGMQQQGASDRQDRSFAQGQQNALELGEQKQRFSLESLDRKNMYDKESDVRGLGLDAAKAGSIGPGTRNLIDYQGEQGVTPSLEGLTFDQPKADRFSNVRPTMNKKGTEVIDPGGVLNEGTGEIIPRQMQEEEEKGGTSLMGGVGDRLSKLAGITPIGRLLGVGKEKKKPNPSPFDVADTNVGDINQGQPSFGENDYNMARNVMKSYNPNNPDPEQKKYIDALYETNPDLVEQLYSDMMGQ